MSDFYAVYIYLGLAAFVTLTIILASGLFPAVRSAPAKFLPYESGIKTEVHLLQKRFPLRHYLVGLIFLVFDLEIIFLYPWAVVAKQIGAFAFYEMVFFMVALLVGFAYVWRKGGLQWE